MCRRVTCSRCDKPTFAGCGAHVEQVLGDVPQGERCRCAELKASGELSAADADGGWLRKLFSKS
jgi:hypothetical protein